MHIQRSIVVNMKMFSTSPLLWIVALVLCYCTTALESRPLKNLKHHNIAKRSTIAEVLGDLTPEQEGILNEKDVPLANCKQIFDSGRNKSGLYRVDPGDDKGEFTVFCDMNLRDGGWTVFLRRIDDGVSFAREWKEYRNGFGFFDSNFWLGLEKMKRITDYCGQTFELYIGLESFQTSNNLKWSEYASFSLDTELNDYKLTIGTFNTQSTAGNSLGSHSGEKFSTSDEDNDSHTTAHCANDLNAGWWYHNCHDAHLTGMWYDNGVLPDSNVLDGIIWDGWLGETYSLKTAVMAVRPA